MEDGNHVFSIPVHPDLILMDIRMPGMDGVLACDKRSKEHYPDIKIIILTTTCDDDKFIYSALKYGASGYLLKGASTERTHKND